MPASQVMSLQDMILAVKKLRDEVPEFNANDPDCKEKIDHYHQSIHSLILSVQQEVGFASYESALDFIDNEVAILGRLA